MHGSSIAMGAGNPLPDSAAVDLLDDILFTIGTDSDSVILNRSNTNLANTAITGVLEGTPVTPALAANTLIISNTTNDGDILIAASDGGTSKACFFFDASAPDLILYQIGGTWTAGATAWTIPAVTLGGAVAGGDQAFTNVGDMTFAAGSILASGSTNGNTLLIRANDTTFLTLTTGATDVCELAGVTLSGATLVADGGTIGCAGQPILTFNDTGNQLEVNAPLMVTGNVGATTHIRALAAGSDTAYSGPVIGVGNADNTRSWAIQLSNSNHMHFHYYNGTSWALKAVLPTTAAGNNILVGNGVSFGPGAVASITVVDGQITAIS